MTVTAARPTALAVVLLCPLLSACVTNTLATRNDQLQAGAVSLPPPRPVPVRRPVTGSMLAAARSITVRKTTTAGADLQLASLQALGPDCAPSGEVVVKVLAEPEHGTLTVQQGTAFPNYGANDPRAVCNDRRAPATVLTFRAAGGFTGLDQMSVRAFFPDGRSPSIRFDISVE